ncbi:hypothetical protein HYZ97_01675 [Candidatus Pacearchaeota archaeon]|nr:hypothetical protein [Candidatus Pacearchaeota archaeon]
MNLESIAGFVEGFGVGFLASSPVEWMIHKHLLHAPKKKRNFLSRMPSEAHEDNHHHFYDGRQHYYRDETNKNAVSHFSPSDVSIIAASAALIGYGYNAARASLGSESSWERVAGFTAGAMVYYTLYETTHAIMHVLEQERLTVGKALGDAIQAGKPDGKLRLPKPLLDEIRTRALDNLSAFHASQNRACLYAFPAEIEQQLDAALSYNHQRGVILEKIQPAHVYLAETMNNLTSLSEKRGLAKWRFQMYKTIRKSPVFAWIDNHHFLHHQKYGANLNVVLPLADYLARTKMNSSKAVLTNPAHWLCPNAPC